MVKMNGFIASLSLFALLLGAMPALANSQSSDVRWVDVSSGGQVAEYAPVRFDRASNVFYRKLGRHHFCAQYDAATGEFIQWVHRDVCRNLPEN